MRILFLILFFIGFSGLAAAAPRVALVIGNSDYVANFDLANPGNDARDISKALTDHGFEVTMALDASRAEMIAALRDFRTAADRSEIAMVYFSGHAIEAAGENYLIPTDADLMDIRDVPELTVSLSSILRQTSGARKLRMVVLDACRDNPFVPNMRNPGGTKSIGRGLSRVAVDAHNVLVAYAAAEGDVTPDGDPGGNSPYTASFLEALNGPPRDVGLFMRVVGEAMRNRTDLQSMPFVYSSLPADELIINPGRGSVSTNVATPTETAPAPPIPDPAPEMPVMTDRERAQRIQAELNRLNCGPLVEDGLFGRKSSAALKRFYDSGGEDIGDLTASPGVLAVLQAANGKICPTLVVRSVAPRSVPVAKPDPVDYSYTIWDAGVVPHNQRVSANTSYGTLVCYGGRGRSIARRCSWQ